MQSVAGADPGSSRVVIVAFGTQGDIRPLCILGRELQRGGREVRVVTVAEYGNLVRSFDLACHGIEADFEHLLSEPGLEALFRGFFTSAVVQFGAIRRLLGEIEDKLLTLLRVCAAEIRDAALVIFNPFAFFAGAVAAELSIPSVQVTCQPLLATRRAPLCIFGGRDLGPIGNRLSYEALRPLMVLLRGAFHRFRSESGLGRSLRAWTNPLTSELHRSRQILAYSLAISPDPGDWPIRPTCTGFWLDDPRPDEHLPPAVETFLAAGDPPVYIGLGSMFWGAERNSDLIMKAVALWGGRAIVGRGAGGLLVPDPAPGNVLPIGFVHHALLFPRLAGCVHHGGAGTTARALRAGLGSIVLPMLGDQLFWGRRVADLGAGGPPVLLSRITPEHLAERLSDLVSNAGYRRRAGGIAAALSADPGVAAAVVAVNRLLTLPRAAHG